MRFYLPRRYRGKLLFPPGLLALAGLLWLGCVAVGSWQERLIRRTVVQLTMPPKPVSDTIYSYAPRTIPFLYSQLFTVYKWQEIDFNGNAAHDSVAALSVSQNIQALRNDTIPNCGVRVQLTPQVTYKALVKLIDLMAVNDQRKYLFDMYHGPFTLYVLVDEYQPQLARPVEPQIFCGTMYHQLDAGYRPPAIRYWSVSYFTRIGNWLAALWNPKLKDTSWYTSAAGTGTEYDITLQLEKRYWPDMLKETFISFRQSEWRLQFLLIIGMTAISWWKLKRQLQYQ